MSDQAQRQRALCPQTSFIVQAPAGSGKTQLPVLGYCSALPKDGSTGAVYVLIDA